MENRANEIYAGFEPEASGHARDWARAESYAHQEAEDKAQAQSERARKVALWAEYKVALRAAGVSEQAMRVLAPADAAAFLQLPESISLGRIAFSSEEKAIAIKSALRVLWLALGYGEPNFAPFDFETERNRKHQDWIQFPG